MAIADPIVIEIRLRWWVWLYLDALRTFVFITGAQPDVEKTASFIARRAVTYRVARTC